MRTVRQRGNPQSRWDPNRSMVVGGVWFPNEDPILDTPVLDGGGYTQPMVMTEEAMRSAVLALRKAVAGFVLSVGGSKKTAIEILQDDGGEDEEFVIPVAEAIFGPIRRVRALGTGNLCYAIRGHTEGGLHVVLDLGSGRELYLGRFGERVSLEILEDCGEETHG